MNALQEFKDFDLVCTGKETFIDSLSIAGALGIEHRALLQSINKYENDIEISFGKVAFEMRSGYNNCTVRVALLSEDQALFIGTLSRNTDKVIEFKTRLVTSFQNARRTAQELSKTMLPSDPHDQVLMLCEKLTAMTIEAKQLTQKLIEQQPAIDAWKQFVDTDGLIDMVYVAQTCGVGKNRLYRKLREEKVFHYDSEYNAVYQQYIDRGYFDVRFVSNKNIGSIPVIRCTPKGAEWIYNKFYRKQAA